jgi:threonyl-tRNA synthetase
VREAEREWIPYTVVIGDRELSGPGVLTVRPRSGVQEEMAMGDFLGGLAAEVSGKPALLANMPRLLSKRPIFVG